MIVLKHAWRNVLFCAAAQIAAEKDIEWNLVPENLPIENPPKTELGDIAFPLFVFAKVLRSAPPKIAQEMAEVLHKVSTGILDFTTAASDKNELKESIESFRSGKLGTWEVLGPYINIRLNRTEAMQSFLSDGETPNLGSLLGKKVMVEFSCPNTNKPLHLGHLRNDALGESVSRIVHAAGAEVKKVNLINNRGIHICKSMLAYKKFGAGETPESTGMKSDHFVGKYYVKYAEWEKTDKNAEKQAQEMLLQWESGDPETIELWNTMNSWALTGIEETYKNTHVGFDHYYFESETYLLGRQRILEGLEAGVFYKDEEGTTWIDLEDIGLDKKVLLRRDGTSLYITQDVGTAIHRHGDFPFEQLVYVVASEQQYHFKVLFAILDRLGYSWAKNLFHLSYGMVNLPDGKMKSREGTVVDADDLLEQLTNLAKQEIIEKNREEQITNLDKTAHDIALGALHYYLLQTSPTKDMIFNPKESLAFNGNTGPYLQYTGARISSMLRKWKKEIPSVEDVDLTLLDQEVEWELVKLVSQYNEMVDSAALSYNPSIIASYLYEIAKTYSRFYHDLPILNAEDTGVTSARVLVSAKVKEVLMKGLHLINVPFLEIM